MFKQYGCSFEGLCVSVFGVGNVVQYLIEKVMIFGVKVIMVFDLSGIVVDESGFMLEKLVELMEVKNYFYGCVSDYVKCVGVVFQLGVSFWYVLVDVVLFCVI